MSMVEVEEGEFHIDVDRIFRSSSSRSCLATIRSPSDEYAGTKASADSDFVLSVVESAEFKRDGGESTAARRRTR